MKKIFTLLLIIFIFTGCICCKGINKYQEENITELKQIKNSSPFGVFTDISIENGRISLDDAIELGNKRTRLVLTWNMVEPKKDKFVFTLPDRVINMHYKAGISLLITLKCDAIWGTKAKGKNLIFTASPPLDMARYEKFLETVVMRYKGKVQYWQIENEVFDNRLFTPLYWDGTKEEYLDLLSHAYRIIKKSDPEGQVVLAGFPNELFNVITGKNTTAPVAKKDVEDFFNYLMDKGKSNFDIIDFHQYNEPETVYSEVKLLRDTMKKYGYERDLICTEAGDLDLRLFASHFSDKSVPVIEEFLNIPEVKEKLDLTLKGGVTTKEFIDFGIFLKKNKKARPILERYQAENLVKRICLTLALGVKEIYSSVMMDNHNIDSFWAIMGLTDRDGRKKPHYYTYKILIKKLESFTKAEEIKGNPEEKIVKFTFKDKSPVFVLWCDGGKRVINVSSYLSTDKVRVSGIITEENKTDKDILVERAPSDCINIDKTPIFLEAL